MAKSISDQIKELEKKLRDYSDKEVPRAAKRAIGVVARKAKVELVKTATKELKVPSKILNSQIYAIRAKGSGIRAYIKSYLRPISAIRLLRDAVIQKSMGTGTNRRGVRVAGTQFDGAFINRGVTSGNAYVLQREGRGRYPLKRINIKIDLTLQLNQLPIAKRFTRDQFQAELLRELNFRISKYGG